MGTVPCDGWSPAPGKVRPPGPIPAPRGVAQAGAGGSRPQQTGPSAQTTGRLHFSRHSRRVACPARSRSEAQQTGTEPCTRPAGPAGPSPGGGGCPPTCPPRPLPGLPVLPEGPRFPSPRPSRQTLRPRFPSRRRARQTGCGWSRTTGAPRAWSRGGRVPGPAGSRGDGPLAQAEAGAVLGGSRGRRVLSSVLSGRPQSRARFRGDRKQRFPTGPAWTPGHAARDGARGPAPGWPAWSPRNEPSVWGHSTGPRTSPSKQSSPWTPHALPVPA